MPEPAIIPAPIAYIKFVAVKKLVVEILIKTFGLALGASIILHLIIFGRYPTGIKLLVGDIPSFTVKKIECSKQA